MVRRRSGVVDGHAADDVAAEPSQVIEAEARLAAPRASEPRQQLLSQLRSTVPHLHPSTRQFLPQIPPLFYLYAPLSLSLHIYVYIFIFVFLCFCALSFRFLLVIRHKNCISLYLDMFIRNRLLGPFGLASLMISSCSYIFFTYFSFLIVCIFYLQNYSFYYC